MTVGSILGITVAYFSYRQYYPDLADKLSHRPYSPRIKDQSPEPVLPVHTASQDQGYDPVGAGNRHESFELEGTVPRPGPQRLQDVWKDQDDSGMEDSGADRQPLRGRGDNH